MVNDHEWNVSLVLRLLIARSDRLLYHISLRDDFEIHTRSRDHFIVHRFEQALKDIFSVYKITLIIMTLTMTTY